MWGEKLPITAAQIKEQSEDVSISILT